MYKNNDIRLELSRLARIVDPKMKIQGEVSYKCENVPTLDPISFETPEAYISLPKWNTKRMGSISFDFRTTEPNGLILFTHGKPQERKDAARSQKNTKVGLKSPTVIVTFKQMCVSVVLFFSFFFFTTAPLYNSEILKTTKHCEKWKCCLF